MPDKSKTSSKTKEERQQIRIDRLTEDRKEEAKRAGVDLDAESDIGPSTAERKKRIDDITLKGVQGDIKTGLKQIQDLRQPPKVDASIKPTSDLTIRDVRKNRRNKIADIMNSFAQGALGETVTPSLYRDRAKGERLAQYEQFKGTTQAAKKTLSDWENSYINEQLDYLKAKRDNPNTSDLERKQLQRQIEKTEAQISTEKARANKLRVESNAIKNKKEKKPEESKVKISEDLGGGVKSTYETTKPEADKLKTDNQTKLDLEEVEKEYNIKMLDIQDQLDKMNKTNEGTSWIEWKDRPLKAKLENELTTLQQELANKQKEIKSKNTSPKGSSGGSILDDILNNVQ